MTTFVRFVRSQVRAQKTLSGSSGFTLIELLVVVSIIAILSFTVVTNLSSARQKARDAKISADLSEIDKGITLYVANANDLTAISGTKTFTDLITALKAQGYIPAAATIAHPVASQSYFYEGKVAAGAGELTYRLCAQQERPADAAKPFFIDESGSSFSSASNQCTVPLP